MRDYIWETADGRRMPVLEMPQADLVDALRDGITVAGPVSTESAESFMERLRIELVIRSLPT